MMNNEGEQLMPLMEMYKDELAKRLMELIANKVTLPCLSSLRLKRLFGS